MNGGSMRLSEITRSDQEPLLITMLRKLLDDGHRVWTKGSFSMLEVKGIGQYTGVYPAFDGDPAYSGMVYDIKVYHGVGFGITPPEAETDWVLVHIEDRDRGHEQYWELKRNKK